MMTSEALSKAKRSSSDGDDADARSSSLKNSKNKSSDTGEEVRAAQAQAAQAQAQAQSQAQAQARLPPYYMSTSGESLGLGAHQQQRGAAPVNKDECAGQDAGQDDCDHVTSEIVNELKHPERAGGQDELDLDMAMIDIPDLPAEDEATSRRPMPLNLFADLELNVDADIADIADIAGPGGAEPEAETGADTA